jgi:hypothetical protein
MRLILRIMIFVVELVAFLFIPAGRIDLPRFWAFIAVYLFLTLIDGTGELAPVVTSRSRIYGIFVTFEQPHEGHCIRFATAGRSDYSSVRRNPNAGNVLKIGQIFRLFQRQA